MKLPKYSIAIFAFLLIAVYVFVFLLPNHFENFALDPVKIKEGHYWRFLTYPFAHYNIAHLVENIVGLVLAVIIAIELKTLFSDFSSTYLATGFLAIIPIWAVMQFIALGASTAIYGAFGLVSLETPKYDLKPWLPLIILTFLIFAKTLYVLFLGSNQELTPVLRQGISHFSGLVFGCMFFIFLGKIKPLFIRKKLYCLRGM